MAEGAGEYLRNAVQRNRSGEAVGSYAVFPLRVPSARRARPVRAGATCSNCRRPGERSSREALPTRFSFSSPSAFLSTTRSIFPKNTSPAAAAATQPLARGRQRRNGEQRQGTDSLPPRSRAHDAIVDKVVENARSYYPELRAAAEGMEIKWRLSYMVLGSD